MISYNIEISAYRYGDLVSEELLRFKSKDIRDSHFKKLKKIEELNKSNLNFIYDEYDTYFEYANNKNTYRWSYFQEELNFIDE